MGRCACCSMLQDGNTAVIKSTCLGHDTCLRQLIDARANVNAANKVSCPGGIVCLHDCRGEESAA